MKGKTSDWFATLTQRAMKDLVNLLFTIDGKVQGQQHYELFVELRQHLDDEYHGLKRPW